MSKTIQPGTPIDPETASRMGWSMDAVAPQVPPPAGRADVGPVFGEARAGGPPSQKDPMTALSDYARGERPERSVRWYTFPSKYQAAMIDGGLPQEQMRFAVGALTTVEEERVHGMYEDAGQQKLAVAMVKSAIIAIGGERATDDMRNKWWEQIGPIGRGLVLRCYQDMNFADEAAGEAILGTAEPGRI